MKKRDWKAINAKRPTAIGAKTMGVSRYAVEELRRLHRLAGDEFDERMLSGELTIPEAFKIVRERTMKTLDGDTQALVRIEIAEAKIRKYWKCMLAAAHQTCIPEHRIKAWFAMILNELS